MRKVEVDSAFFRGAVSIERAEQGLKPWRIPYEQYELFPPSGLNNTAEISSGVRLAFASDTEQLEVHVAPSEHVRSLDCVLSGTIHDSIAIAAGSDVAVFAKLPPGSKRIEIYLPQNTPIIVKHVMIDDHADIAPTTTNRIRWITYGSSITQCAGAASPALTWPAIVARANDWDLTCLGFSGNCHLEPMVARMIRDLDADFISLCLGINVMGNRSLNMRTFRPAVIGLLSTIRERHPDTPIAVISPIYCPDREAIDNAVEVNLVKLRHEIVEAIRALRQYGDRNLHYINGLDVLSEAYVDYLPDRLHPNAEGYQIMARHMIEQFDKLPIPARSDR